MTDPIADMLARIRNATQSRHPRVDMPLSRLKVEIAKILQHEGYIQAFQAIEPKNGEPQGTLRVMLSASAGLAAASTSAAMTSRTCSPVLVRAS